MYFDLLGDFFRDLIWSLDLCSVDLSSYSEGPLRLLSRLCTNGDVEINALFFFSVRVESAA